MRVFAHLDLTDLGAACETQHPKLTGHFRSAGLLYAELHQPIRCRWRLQPVFVKTCDSSWNDSSGFG